MNSDIVVEGTLTLSSGSINTNSNTLEIAAGGSIARSKNGSKDCKCVNGILKQNHSSTAEVEYNVGDGTRYRPVFIAPSTASAEAYSVQYFNTQYTTTTCSDNGPGGALDHIASSYYNITRDNSVNAVISIEWYDGTQSSDDGDDLVDDVSSIRLCHFSAVSQGGDDKWDALTTSTTGAGGSGSASTSTGRASATATSFSPFALGSSNSGNPLPIDLVSFNGVCKQSELELEFVVASQINNDYFTIERSSNNEDWTIIGEIAGAGNTSKETTYQFKDYNPSNGVSYYRLSQTDFDGKVNIFAPISVSCDNSDIEDYSIYPNPAKDELMIDIELHTHQGDNISLQLVDINGKVIMQEKISLARGYNNLNMDIAELPSGIYLLKFTGTKNHIKEKRLIKQ